MYLLYWNMWQWAFVPRKQAGCTCNECNFLRTRETSSVRQFIEDLMISWLWQCHLYRLVQNRLRCYHLRAWYVVWKYSNDNLFWCHRLNPPVYVLHKVIRRNNSRCVSQRIQVTLYFVLHNVYHPLLYLASSAQNMVSCDVNHQTARKGVVHFKGSLDYSIREMLGIAGQDRKLKMLAPVMKKLASRILTRRHPGPILLWGTSWDLGMDK